MSKISESRKIPVIIDDREYSGAIPGALHDSELFNVSIARLKSGDYQVDNRFLFERKTLPDFAASVISGRLFKQTLRLATNSPLNELHPALVLEGVSGDLQGCGISREALQGALISITVFMGLPVVRSRSPRETVQVFRYVAEQGRARAAGALSRPGYRPRGKTALQYHLLQSFPGIGPARAKTLLDRFGTPRGVLNAREEDLTSVAGIGSSTAHGILWLLE